MSAPLNPSEDPMLSPDPAVRQAYSDNLKKLIEQAVSEDAPTRRYWASRNSDPGSSNYIPLIGASGFGDGPHAVGA